MLKKHPKDPVILLSEGDSFQLRNLLKTLLGKSRMISEVRFSNR